MTFVLSLQDVCGAAVKRQIMGLLMCLEVLMKLCSLRRSVRVLPTITDCDTIRRESRSSKCGWSRRRRTRLVLSSASSIVTITKSKSLVNIRVHRHAFLLNMYLIDDNRYHERNTERLDARGDCYDLPHAHYGTDLPRSPSPSQISRPLRSTGMHVGVDQNRWMSG